MNHEARGFKNRGELKVTTGTEGPKHDPYSYSEYTFNKDGVRYTIHLGLAEWLKIGDEIVSRNYEDSVAKFNEAFGQDLNDYLAEQEEASCTCKNCGTDEFLEDRPGFPGESFLVCAKCETIVDSSFNESAII